MAHTVYYIEGDGIGPEIWKATRPVMDAALRLENVQPLEWRQLAAGEAAMRDCGQPLPEDTLKRLADASLAMKGPLGTPVGKGIRSLNVALRQGLDLYACVRPVRHIPGLGTPVRHPEKVDMVIFRENTEDVYAGIEYAAGDASTRRLVQFLREELGVASLSEDAALGLKPMTRKGSQRLVRKAIEYALQNGRKSVTLVHKGNIMKFTEGAFRQWGHDLAMEEFAEQTCREGEEANGRLVIKDRIADAMFQEALLHPDQYDVLATPNLNGDYLSDALAAQVGGLGLAPGVNMSDKLAFFEATHGTAPQLAGKDMANPGSLMLCGAMLLEHIGEKRAAQRIRGAIASAIAAKTVPADLAGQMENARVTGCAEFGEIVGAAL